MRNANVSSRRYTSKENVMQTLATARISLTALLGTPVTDAQGQLRGRIKDIAVATGPEAGKVAGLVLEKSQWPVYCSRTGSDGNARRNA